MVTEIPRTGIDGDDPSSLLAEAAAAIARGEIAAAERLLDRAHRRVPDDPALILTLGRVMAINGRHAALRRLIRGDRADLSPEAGLLLVEALLQTGDHDAALEAADRLLTRYAVSSLGNAATILSGLAERDVAGWIGRTVIGSLAGWVREPGVLRLQRADAAWTLGQGSFEIPATWAGIQETAQISFSAGRLLGGVLAKPAFDFTGEVSIEDGALVGAARLGWSPASPLTLTVTDGAGQTARIVLDGAANRAMVAPTRFSFRPAEAGLGAGPFFVTAILPDGGEAVLAGSPVQDPLLRRSIPIADPPPPRHASRSERRPVAIVVPVYSGRVETLACLQSVRATTDPAQVEVIVVDDAGPDAELSADLGRLAATGAITLLRNERNSGFPFSANRGIVQRPWHDIVLLNADTQVFGDWLDRLAAAAYAADDIGMVTPLSNSGSIVSYPGGRESAVDSETACAIDAATREANAGSRPDLPTAIGFCLYLRRDCLNETGALNAEMFGQGYGEEDDLAARARRLGWRAVAAADVYVHHLGGVSFGRMRLLRSQHATALMERLHPGYGDAIDRFMAADPLWTVRRRIDLARLPAPAGDLVLFVTLGIGGGVGRYLAHRAEAGGFRSLSLQPDPAERSNGRCRLVWPESGLADLVFHLPDELDLLTRTLRQIGVARIEFHHLLGLSPTVLDLPHLLGLPYEVHIHDYAWICPRIVLVTEAGRYCGEPDLDGCDACIARDGSELEEAIATGPLRERSRRLFAGASRIVAATDDTRRRLARYFPASVVHVVPWEAPIPPIAPVRDPIEGRRIRVALIGAFDTHKGLWVLEACARDAARRDLPLEFVLIGHSVADARLFQTGRVFVTGRFEEAEIADLLARERCDVAFFPSVCPETWSYSLSHAMRAGLPILGFDLGAIGSRLRDRPWARVVSPDTTAPELNQQLWELASEPGHRHNAARAADNPSFTDSKGYEKLITDVDRAAPAEGTSNVTSSVQILNLGEGLYSFAVREGGPSAAPDANISLPALQISTGPATKRGGQLTLLAAPSMPSPWLTRAGDVVIAQVAGGPCPVVLTSLGLANSPPLDVEVRRLDEAGAAKPPQPAIEPARIVAGSNREPAPAVAAVPVPAAPASTDSSVRLQVLTHIQNRGDVPFIGGNWAGFVGQSVWMEAFAVAPLDRLGPNAIEYKGRTAGGFETPWLSGGVWCGTRGMGVPLVEFAVRLAPEFAAAYECEYRGAFFSGSIVGPLKDGMPCRSRVPNDPLEAIQLRVGDRRLVRR